MSFMKHNLSAQGQNGSKKSQQEEAKRGSFGNLR